MYTYMRRDISTFLQVKGNPFSNDGLHTQFVTRKGSDMLIAQQSGSVLHEQVLELLNKLVTSSTASHGDLGAAEEAAHRFFLELRPLVMTAVVAASASSVEADVMCPSCQVCLRVHSRRNRRIVTSEGEAEHICVRYRCNGCDRDYYPFEEANALTGSQFTLGAKVYIAQCSADMPYAPTSAAVVERGIFVSAKEVDRTANEVSGWRCAEEDEAVRQALGDMARDRDDPVLPIHDWTSWGRDEWAILSVDGAKVRSPDKNEEGALLWFECRAGVIAPASEKSRSPSFMVGGIKDPDEVFRLLLASWRCDPLKRRACLFIADGADWIWNRVPIYFPEARPVLDIYHAGEHVAAAAIGAWGAGSELATQWQRGSRELLLEEDGPQRIRQTLRDVLDAGNAVNPDELRKNLAYLDNHKDRMPYRELKDAGLPVGSGVMESAIKQIDTVRLRRPGMKWSRRGADQMIRLRATHLSGSLIATVTRKRLSAQTQAQRLRPATHTQTLSLHKK